MLHEGYPLVALGNLLGGVCNTSSFLLVLPEIGLTWAVNQSEICPKNLLERELPEASARVWLLTIASIVATSYSRDVVVAALRKRVDFKRAERRFWHFWLYFFNIRVASQVSHELLFQPKAHIRPR